MSTPPNCSPIVWILLEPLRWHVKSWRFYTTRPEKGGLLSIGCLSRKSPFTPYSNHYKNWRDRFARMKGRKGSLILLGVDCAPLFHLAWTDESVAISGHEHKL